MRPSTFIGEALAELFAGLVRLILTPVIALLEMLLPILLAPFKPFAAMVGAVFAAIAELMLWAFLGVIRGSYRMVRRMLGRPVTEKGEGTPGKGGQPDASLTGVPEPESPSRETAPSGSSPKARTEGRS